jgi:hypothetical protein
MNSITNLSPKALRQAADIQDKILELQNEFGQLLGATVESASEAPSKRRKVSAAGRARMRAAQLARWAKIKGTAPSAESALKPRKRKLSAEGLAKIRAGVAKRMAARGKAVQKLRKKRKMTPAWRAALERAWEARRAKTAEKSKA